MGCMQLVEGSNLKGKITGITNFGAFVQLEGGKSGLVHISEIAIDYVKNIEEHVKVGDEVKVKIVAVSPEGKISLSIKKVLEEEAEKARKNPRPADVDNFSKPNTADMSFEDKISKFKLDSDERMLALKRNFESKRGSGRRGR